MDGQREKERRREDVKIEEMEKEREIRMKD